MEFDDIMRFLKRFSFSAKMGISQINSISIMSPYGIIDINELQKKVYPWEIEIFALFSILSSGEYQYKEFDPKNIRTFYNIVNSIREYMHPKLHVDTETVSFADRFLVMTGLSQFSVQESIFYKLYRYNYFFQYRSDEFDMAQRFLHMFGCPYNDFRKSAFAINLLISSKIGINAVLDYIIKTKYTTACSALMISRQEFIRKQNAITTNIADYYYCFKYFAQYPFVEECGVVHLPLPHLVVQASTSSLLFRLTENNNQLRDYFGKMVLENYIAMIFRNSNDYDEVVVEYPYGTPEKRTSDVMVRKHNTCLLVESKAMVPSQKIRIYDDPEISRIIERTASAVIQLYRNVICLSQNEYYPFSEIVKFDLENIFGVVVLLEDHYIRRNLIYQRVAKKLQLSEGGREYNYICSNIKIFSLYELESKIFERYNVLSLLELSKEKPKNWFDYRLSNEGCVQTGCHVLNEFINDSKNDILLLADEMKENGIIQ